MNNFVSFANPSAWWGVLFGRHEPTVGVNTPGLSEERFSVEKAGANIYTHSST